MEAIEALALVSGHVEEELLIRNEYLAAKRDQDTTWVTFIKNHQDVIAACDFFTTEVITPAGLITYYV